MTRFAPPDGLPLKPMPTPLRFRPVLGVLRADRPCDRAGSVALRHPPQRRIALATNKRRSPARRIERLIIEARGHRVLLDEHLAELYGVTLPDDAPLPETTAVEHQPTLAQEHSRGQ